MIAEIAIAGTAAVVGVSARWNWWRPIVTGGIPALMYHKIGAAPPSSELRKLWVLPDDFRRHLAYMKTHGYTSIVFSDWINAAKGIRPLPDKPVLITFDDGYMNNYDLAYPLLREFGMKGCVFLVHETIDKHNAWHDPTTEPWVKMLTWSQISEMKNSGIFEFGSHTMSHRNLAALTPEEVRWEVAESKKRLEERLDDDVVAFAYPYGSGAYAPEVRAAVTAAGYRFDFGIKQGICPRTYVQELGPLKRLLIRGDETILDLHLNMTRGRGRL